MSQITRWSLSTRTIGVPGIHDGVWVAVGRARMHRARRVRGPSEAFAARYPLSRPGFHCKAGCCDVVGVLAIAG
jgi:hypothetical protein